MFLYKYIKTLKRYNGNYVRLRNMMVLGSFYPKANFYFLKIVAIKEGFLIWKNDSVSELDTFFGI